VGANGQFQLLLVTNGFGGTMFYLAFFAYGAWRYRRDATPYGLAGVLVLLMGFVFMIAYDAVGEPLCFTMLAYALLWRNDTYLQSPDPDSGALTEEPGPTGARQRAITSRAPGALRQPRPAGPARA
jgi:predicted tellurium resistance membrane protein TerC